MQRRLSSSLGLLVVAFALVFSVASGGGGGDDNVSPTTEPAPPAPPPPPEEDPILVPPTDPGAVCGDGTCVPDEECGACDADCANLVVCLPTTCEGAECAYCGDGACHANLEGCEACPEDCGLCATDDDEATKLLARINAARASGLTCPTSGWQAPAGALSFDHALNAAAEDYSLSMATNDFFSHTGLDGSTPAERVAAAGYPGAFRAENLAAGYLSADEVFAGWHASDGHCVGMMVPGANDAGIGYAHDGSATYRHYWTLNLGQR